MQSPVKTEAHIQTQGNALSPSRWALQTARLLLPLLLFLVFAGEAQAQTKGTTAEGLVYSAISGQITITGHAVSLSGSVSIPASINVSGSNLPVTGIGDNAFKYCTALTNVVIPNSVTTIGYSAFYWCSSLTGVTISNSVTWIKDSTFQGCSRLTSVTIPNSVTYIGYSAFNGCNSLTDITIPNSVTSIGGSAFYCCTSLTNVTIPNSVTSIGDSAFYYCTSLTNVTIPGSVNLINSHAFDCCANLTSVTISPGITSIADYAFDSCRSLTSISIPNGVTSIGNSAFQNCTGLVSATVPGSVTSIGDSAFYGCSNLTNLTISNGVNSIGRKAFDSTGLISVTLPSSVTSIGLFAFENCQRLTAVTISNGVTDIGAFAFYLCYNLTSINIPDSVTSIGDYAFASCWLKFAVFMGNSPSLGASIFSGAPAPSFAVYYLNRATGFDSTTWNDVSGNNFPLVNMGTLSPVITSTPLASGTAGTAYTQALTASGGIPPYTWSIVSGSLPSGLSLDSSGVISGTANDIATANFTLQVADSNGMSSTTDTSLTMNPASTGVPALPPWACVVLSALLILVAGRSLPTESYCSRERRLTP